MSINTAIIICGGIGSRVKEITKDKIPKIMIPINGKPFVDYLIYSLLLSGIHSLHFAAGFKADVLEKYLNDFRKKDPIIREILSTRVYVEKEPMGTGGAVSEVIKSYPGAFHGPFLVINGDTLLLHKTDFDDEYNSINDASKRLDGKEVDFIMFSANMYNDGRYGIIEHEYRGPASPFNNGNEYVTKFRNGEPGYFDINCGWYITHKKLFENYQDVTKTLTYPNGKKMDHTINKNIGLGPCSLERDLLPKWIKEGKRIIITDINEKAWVDIGEPNTIKRTEALLK